MIHSILIGLPMNSVCPEAMLTVMRTRQQHFDANVIDDRSDCPGVG
jgi:hypothetical protein